MKNKIMGLIFVLLMMSLPASSVQQIKEPTQEPLIKSEKERINASVKVGGGELNAELILPSQEDFKIDKNLTISGQDTFASDFILHVNRYEPTVLTSSLIEEAQTPVYAFISGTPLIELGSIPKIRSMTFTVVGGDMDKIARPPEYRPPPVFSHTDLGYITTFIKRIPREEDVPDRIDIKLRARIIFEGDITVPVLGGKEVKILRESRSRDIFEEGGFVDPRYEIFGGRGYLRVSRILGAGATFDFYNTGGVRIGSDTISVGQETQAYNLFPGTTFQEDTVRVRLDRIIRATEEFVSFKSEGEEFRLNKDHEIKTSGWFVRDFFISREDGQDSYVVFESLLSGRRIILIPRKNEQEMKEWYHKIFATGSDGMSLLLKIRAAINTVQGKINEVSQDLIGIRILSSQAASFLARNFITSPEEIDSLFTEFIHGLSFDDIENNEFPLDVDIMKGDEGGAKLRVGGSVGIYKEGQTIGQPSCIDKNNVEHYCEITGIGDETITVRYPVGENCNIFEAKTLYINEEVFRAQRDRIIQREGGLRDIPPSIRTEIRYDRLDKCGGVSAELLDIETNNQVEVTILAGPRAGYAESILDLHFPIEKRAIELSPDKIESQIESTKELIEDFNGMIDKLEKFVGVWSKVCLGVSAWFTIEAFLTGLPKYKKAQGEKARYTSEFIGEKTFYTRDINQPLPTGKTKDDYRVEGIEDYNYYRSVYKNGQFEKELLDREYIVKLYDENGHVYEYDEFRGQPVSESDFAGSERNSIHIYRTDSGEQRIIVPTGDIKATKAAIASLSTIGVAENVGKKLEEHGERGYYLVYGQGDSVQVCKKRGDTIDFREINVHGADKIDFCIIDFPKTGGSALDRGVYASFERSLDRVREAQLRGSKNAFFAGRSYTLDDRGGLPGKALNCYDILGENKCKLLFNACDPVVCPRSRCDLAGQYREIGPSGVIGSGLLGSLVLCLPNIKQERGGVVAPLCLSGILASLKGIRSYLEQHVACLEKQKIEGTSTGICDQMRSIFICSLIWREGITLLKAKGGLYNLLGRSGGGGDEYFRKGIGGSLDEANEVVSFMVNDYGDDVFAAYRGKGLPDIGAEVCKASIAQRIPFIDALVQEFGTPENPPQYTAYFEEAPYAPTLGKSQYKVYFHIYAGTPRREAALQFVVYMKSFGSSPRLLIASGTLPPGESADESVDIVGDSGYQEICVVLNGLEDCSFGRVVSSSLFLSTFDSYLTSTDLAQEITTAAQCKADATLPISYSLTTGTVPYARVLRRCSVTNPGLGIGEENYWKFAGSCGLDAHGVSLGKCYEFTGKQQRFSETEKQALSSVCVGGGICESNEFCDTSHGARILSVDSRGRTCCVPSGRCVVYGSSQLAQEFNQQLTVDYNQKNILQGEVQFNKEGVALGGTQTEVAKILERTGDQGYYVAGEVYCTGTKDVPIDQDPLVICDELFSHISKESEWYVRSRFLLGKSYFERSTGNVEFLDKAVGFLREALDLVGQSGRENHLTSEQKEELANDLVKATQEKEKLTTEKEEEKKTNEKIGKQKEKIDEIIKELNILIGYYLSKEKGKFKFENTTPLESLVILFANARNQLGVDGGNSLGFLKQAHDTLERINLKEDRTFISLKNDLDYIEGELSKLKNYQISIDSVKSLLNGFKEKINKLSVKERHEILKFLDTIINNYLVIPSPHNIDLVHADLQQVKVLLNEIPEPLDLFKKNVDNFLSELEAGENGSTSNEKV